MYEISVKYLEMANSDAKQDKGDKTLLKKITGTAFMLDLVLLCDGLQELSKLSLILKNLCFHVKSEN